MIVVAAHVIVKEGKRGDFVLASQECINETRKEHGNISYQLLTNTEDETKLTFFEEWDSQESLDTHMKTTHFISFGAAINDLLAAPLAINVYSATLL